ncbi:MAG: hypothetical protein JWN04_4252 [Myxococcaceae bacterium]|nr:hypothetical protein [Myxococcaceae bacterium]
MARRVIASSEQTALDRSYREQNPEHGARRREGLLLGAYAVMFVVGVWTVAVAELAPPQPLSTRPSIVTQPTERAPSPAP